MEDRVAVVDSSGYAVDELGGEIAAASDGEGEPPLVELDQARQRVLGCRRVVRDLPQSTAGQLGAGQVVQHLGVVAELGSSKKHPHSVLVLEGMGRGVLSDGGHGAPAPRGSVLPGTGAVGASAA